VDAEINNVIYMELNSGAKMADGKSRKTYVAGSVDRENTAVCCHNFLCCFTVCVIYSNVIPALNENCLAISCFLGKESVLV
jgi:hypothetical protein